MTASNTNSALFDREEIKIKKMVVLDISSLEVEYVSYYQCIMLQNKNG